MSGIDIVQIANGAFAHRETRRMLAMLSGYFDESGTDNQHGHTVIGGFVGTFDQWNEFQPEWQAALDEDGADVFHYSGCVSREKCYEGWDYPSQIKPHLNKMADVLSRHNLIAFTVSHTGDFKSVMDQNPSWSVRFPSPYSLLFEVLIHLMRVVIQGHQIALFMARHPEYSARIFDVYNKYKSAGLWPEIVTCASVDGNVIPAQAADMLAYEARRNFWKSDKVEYWREQPLLSRWLPMHTKGERTIIGVEFDDAGLTSFLRQENGQYLETPASLLQKP